MFETMQHINQFKVALRNKFNSHGRPFIYLSVCVCVSVPCMSKSIVFFSAFKHSYSDGTT